MKNKMSKQVLSIEQMQHLKKIGLNTNYTLQNILDLLPDMIDADSLLLCKRKKEWVCIYIEPYTCSIRKETIGSSLIDATYNMLCWLIENYHSIEELEEIYDRVGIVEYNEIKKTFKFNMDVETTNTKCCLSLDILRFCEYRSFICYLLNKINHLPKELTFSEVKDAYMKFIDESKTKSPWK